MADRTGIEIDYCPKCRGVWLDRGELDKLVERALEDRPAQHDKSSSTPPPAAPVAYQPAPIGYGIPVPMHGYGAPHYPHKYRKHWLSEIFD